MSNIKIRTKLLLSFAVMILVIAAVGVVGFLGARDIRGSLTQIFNTNLPSLGFLLEADRDLHQSLVAERSVIFTDVNSGSFENFAKQHQENQEQAWTRWKKFRELVPDESLKQEFDEFEAAFEKWKATSAQVVEARKTDTWEGRQRAQELSLGQASEEFDSMRNYIDKFTELTNQFAQTAEQNSLKTYANAVYLIIAITCLGVLFGLMFFWLLLRSIIKPLRKIMAASNDLAKGNFDRRIEIQSTDELGLTASHLDEAFDKVVNQAHWYESMLDSIDFPVSVTDMNLNWTFINRAAEQVTGAKRKEVIGKQCSNWGADICKTKKCGVECLRRGQHTSQFTQPGLNKDFQVDAYYLTDKKGQKIGHIEVVQDITEANRIKAEAENALKKGMNEAAQSIEGVVERVTAAAEELSAQVEQISRGAELQAQRISETAISMEEMNSTVIEVARNASNAAGNAEKAKVEAGQGAELVSKVNESVRAVERETLNLKEGMGELGQQVENIGMVMNVINDIADQTNLLALNAAIEAARAGDAGRGFAVVADEVRKLAEKTMTATKEVGDSILAIQKATQKNIDEMDTSAEAVSKVAELSSRSGEALSEIVRYVEDNFNQAQSIATAAEEQSATSEEISRAVEEVNRISAETAGAMTQSASAISDLARMAEELKNIVEGLKR